MKIFCGRSNIQLVDQIVKKLNLSLGLVTTDNHSDGENKISIEENVRGCDVFIVQSTSPPVNDNIMELLIMIDAFRRASPRRITVVVPYFGYSRQDRKHNPRDPIVAKLIANLLTVAGPDRILCFDLHSNQIEGFFDVPVDNLYPDEIFRNFLLERGTLTQENTIIASPDVGGARRARRFAKLMSMNIALIDARVVEGERLINIVGELSENVIIFDDMVDTGTRLEIAAKALKENGVRHVIACCTHGVLSGDVTSLQESDIDELIITNSIFIPEEKKIPKLKIISVAPLLAEAMRRIHNEEPFTFESKLSSDMTMVFNSE